MVKNTDFLISLNTNSYHFRHYDLSYFAMNLNCKRYLPMPYLLKYIMKNLLSRLTGRFWMRLASTTRTLDSRYLTIYI